MTATLYSFADEENAWLGISGFGNGDVYLTAMIGTEHRVDVSLPADEVRVLQLELLRHVAQAKVAPVPSTPVAESARPVDAVLRRLPLAGRALRTLRERAS